ncbi:MAG: cupredoxin domain-containing protein [Chloroflexi bacterium]|nr:cupredoxin domain-containing protein [Chloroflexota bacterium]
MMTAILNPRVLSALLLGILVGTLGIGLTLGPALQAGVAASANYQRPFPMPHQYWARSDEFYVFASGGQQGGMYVYGVPSMKYLSEIPIFAEDQAWGWTTEDEHVRKMLTNPWTGEVATRGDTHHPSASKTDAKYDGRWVFVNDKQFARVARIDLDIFRTGQILWAPNTTGGGHGFNVSPDTKLAVLNLEHEQYPDENIRRHLGLALDPVKGPYAAGINGIRIADDGTMSNGWQIWGPWQFDMARIGWGKSNGWIVTTSYNTERATDAVGMFKQDHDYLFFWNIASIEKALAEKKYVTSKQAPDVPVISWKDVEVYVTPIPLNPHGLDISPTGKYVLTSGKATTLIVAVDFEKVLQGIKEQKFTGEDFGVKVLDPDFVRASTMDLGMGATHIEFDDQGYFYVGFFVDSDIKKVPLGEPYTTKHGKTPWQVTDVLPAHFSVGHLAVPGGDTAQPYGKYVISMNKLAKDSFLPHGPLVAENHELYDIQGERALLVDQMALGPETHYSQILPVSLVAPKVQRAYTQAKAEPGAKPAVEYDYAKKEVRVTMTVVRSFFTPGAITVPQGWKVKYHLISQETALDMTHGFAIDGYNVSVSMDPGEVRDVEVVADKPGVYWFYCNWFCSELHMEMRGRMIVVPESEWPPAQETRLAP